MGEFAGISFKTPDIVSVLNSRNKVSHKSSSLQFLSFLKHYATNVVVMARYSFLGNFVFEYHNVLVRNNFCTWRRYQRRKSIIIVFRKKWYCYGCCYEQRYQEKNLDHSY